MLGPLVQTTQRQFVFIGASTGDINSIKGLDGFNTETICVPGLPQGLEQSFFLCYWR